MTLKAGGESLRKDFCIMCGGEVKGFKCESCGVETEAYDANHVCGARFLLRKCAKCNEPETKCFCEQNVSHNFWENSF
ncbi:MAG: hypothetical protein AAB443_01275 [Patescibacteria group bacterium]